MNEFNALAELSHLIVGKPLNRLSESELRTRIRENCQQINQLKLKLLLRSVDAEADVVLDDIKSTRSSFSVDDYYRVALVSDERVSELNSMNPELFVLRCRYNVNVVAGESCSTCSSENELKERVKIQIISYLEDEIKALNEEREAAQQLLSPRKAA